MRYSILISLILVLGFCKQQVSQTYDTLPVTHPELRVGAERTEIYFPELDGKQVACVANQTSMIGKVHLVDSLVRAGIRVAKVFAPEHGFRGLQAAGEDVSNQIDRKTGIPIVSLYGNRKKPAPDDLKGIGVVLFDIQDVGARFYTYISTLTYVMEACAENGIPLIVLDRPNPNGDYVDGPVLENGYESFVGLHPVPVVHGMTVGEYAQMVNGEGWLRNGIRAALNVIPVEGYTHSTRYSLPVAPSPNLPNDTAVCLYPSVCFFEGTVVSVGRGTDHPFQVIGHPYFLLGSYLFTPESRPEALHPPYEGQHCYGASLTGSFEVCQRSRQLNLLWLIHHYDYWDKQVKDRGSFFSDYFDKLAGNSTLRQQITERKTEEQIRSSWQEGLTKFKSIRQKYLLYPE
ncbi:MAG TPA: DUF1343 domain-containing protein [Bacteroidales bacterium]|nr:DUF1343 domain-containing protein [Bacteroidales bacterium]HNS47697.1 DUF1343 domain-containing protein [Bacteroidales bacterium]